MAIFTPPYTAYCIANSKHDGKSTGDMVQCHLCQNWFHYDCVEESNADIIGLWACHSCQSLPVMIQQLTEMVATLQPAVQQQTEASQLLVTLVSEQSQEITELRWEIANLKTTTSQTPTSESTDVVRSLLVGSSIIKNVDESKLKNMKVICLRGGHISDIRASLARLPSGTRYDRTVIVVGGNDCADERDANEVVEMYRELVQQVKRISTSITVSSICPRNKTEGLTQIIDAVNAGLQSLCSEE